MRVPGEESSKFPLLEKNGKLSLEKCVFFDTESLQCTALPNGEICIFSKLLAERPKKREYRYDHPKYGFVIDPDNQTITRQERKPVRLSYSPLKMLEILFNNMGETVSHAQLFEAAHPGMSYTASDNNSVIQELRRLRAMVDPEMNIIKTIRQSTKRSGGFKLLPPHEVDRNRKQKN